MKVKIYAHTPIPEDVAGTAAALCTASKNKERSLDIAMEAGHESVAQHVSFTFIIQDVSRVLLAQLTRHRLASYSVESQRYAGAPDPVQHLIRPPSFAKHNFTGSVDYAMQILSELYTAMVADGVPEEDARFIIPQGIATRLMLTMNVRELRHFFSLRSCNRAQWEIRELANAMYALCYAAAPKLFEDAGPGCVRGACPEGRRSCGHPVNINRLRNGLDGVSS